VEFLSLLPSGCGISLEAAKRLFQFQKWNSSACSNKYLDLEDFDEMIAGFNSRSGIPQLAPTLMEPELELYFLKVSIPEVEFLSLLLHGFPA